MFLKLGLMQFLSQNASIRAELSCQRVISPTANETLITEEHVIMQRLRKCCFLHNQWRH